MTTQITQKANEFMRIANHLRCGFPPYELLEEVYNRSVDGASGHLFFALANVWYLGYITGKRAERARRNGKSPAVTATTCRAAEKNSTKQYTTI